MTETATVSVERATVSYEYKQNLGNYTSETATVFVPYFVEALGNPDALVDAANDAMNIAKATVAASLGLAAEMRPDGTIEVKAAPIPTVERTAAVNRTAMTPESVADAFGGGSVDAGEWGFQIVGRQHGEIPAWLPQALKKDGVTKVYDNRDGLADNPKRPWFKEAKPGRDAKGYWPPKS